MNIGYVKLDKLNTLEKMYRKLFKIIRVVNNYYYIPALNEKIINKLIEKLKANNIEYVITENNINLNYNKLDGKFLLKMAIPEILDYCFNKLGKSKEFEEIYICVEDFTKENIRIIENLTERVKVVNIVTNHLRQFQELERRLERKETMPFIPWLGIIMPLDQLLPWLRL